MIIELIPHFLVLPFHLLSVVVKRDPHFFLFGLNVLIMHIICQLRSIEMLPLPGRFLRIQDPEFFGMRILHVSNLTLIFVIKLLDLVFKALDRKVILHIKMVLILFNLQNLGLKLCIMGLIFFIYLILVGRLSCGQQLLKLLDFVIEPLNLRNLVLVRIIMGLSILLHFL